MNIQIRTILLGLLSIGFAQSHAQTFALQVKDDRITYLNDELGNRILDFSTCGYQASNRIFLRSECRICILETRRQYNKNSTCHRLCSLLAS